MKTKAQNKKLPNTLHELLDLALNDLEKSEKSGDIIEMATWYKNINLFGLYKYCEVCMAGAVMKNYLNNKNSILSIFKRGPSYYDLDTENKLRIINYLRLGRLLLSGQLFYEFRFNEMIKQKDIQHIDWDITPYEADKDQFKTDIKELINYLKEKNI